MLDKGIRESSLDFTRSVDEAFGKRKTPSMDISNL